MPPKKVPVSLKSSIEAVLDVVASSSEEKVVSKALVALVELTGGEGPKAIRNKSLQVRLVTISAFPRGKAAVALKP